MSIVSNTVVVAAAVHHVFRRAAHAPDSLELGLVLAIADQAARQLQRPAPGAPSPWLQVFLVYRKDRTDARYHTATGMLEITTGPLAKVTYRDLESAALAVVTRSRGNARSGVPVADLPTWRLDCADHGPHARSAPAH